MKCNAVFNHNMYYIPYTCIDLCKGSVQKQIEMRLLWNEEAISCMSCCLSRDHLNLLQSILLSLHKCMEHTHTAG